MTVEPSMASNEVAVAMLQACRDKVCDGPFDSRADHPAVEIVLYWRGGTTSLDTRGRETELIHVDFSLGTD